MVIMGRKKSIRKHNNDCMFDDIIERITRLETDMNWVKSRIEKLDTRLLQILIGVIISILVGIFLKIV